MSRARRAVRLSRPSIVPSLVVPLMLSAALGLGACAVSGPPLPAVKTKPESAPKPAPVAAALRLIPAGFGALNGWAGDDHRAALGALARSCARFSKQPASRPVGPEALFGRMADWAPACAALPAAAGRGAARRYFEANFRVFRLEGADGPRGLITGYYEPELRGSWRRGGKYQYPLYKKPGDLVSVDLGRFSGEWKGRHIAGRVRGSRLEPYDERRRINDGSLAGRGLELLWLDDPVDAFFLHIQGSGRVRMTDGALARVGFAGRNGHGYTAIGRVLVREGELPADGVSMQSIRRWLAANPSRARGVMDANRSYIFFRLIDGEGPIGAQGVALTPGRSLAVDRGKLPLGAPVWLETRDPLERSRPIRRLMIAQDTGGAIRGAVRGDFFWGAGARAEAAAGEMQEPGTFHILLPRTLAIPGS